MTRKLRSQAWFGGICKDAFIHRSWMKNQGLPTMSFDGRPVIGICNTWSELTPCNAHFRDLAEHVKRGVLEAGGFPLEFPVMSLRRIEPAADGDAVPQPRQHGRRGVDPRQPDRWRGAAGRLRQDHAGAADGRGVLRPADDRGLRRADAERQVPRQRHRLRHRRVAALSEDVKRRQDDASQDFMDAESGMSRSAGHCMTMGTASTMASMVEALGVGAAGQRRDPGGRFAARRCSRRLAGRRIVEMVREDLRLSKILTPAAFENAIRVNGAIGGSTNAVMHLLAIAGRVGVDLTLDDWDRLGRGVPTLVDLMPSGRFLMEDFYYAGGLPASMRRVAELRDCCNATLTVNGKTIWENIADARQLQRRGDPPLRPTAEGGGRHRGAARQSGARRRGAQAVGRDRPH